MAGFGSLSYETLVDVATLAAHLGDLDWLVVDVRHQLADTGYGERVYGEAHIPGAVFPVSYTHLTLPTILRV